MQQNLKQSVLTLALLLFTTATVCGKCQYCNSYEDFLADKWTSLDTVYCSIHSMGHQIMWGVSNYKLKTGDKYTDKLLNTAFAVMQADTLYVNCRNLRYEKMRFGKGYCKAARIGEHNLLLAGKLASKEAQYDASSGVIMAAGMVGGVMGGVVGAAVAGGIAGGIGGATSANKLLKNEVCYLITSGADEKGHFNVTSFEDPMMDKLLLSRNLVELHNAYYAEQDKKKRRLAARIIPILEKAGIIE